jgi:hypothetical protein
MPNALTLAIQDHPIFRGPEVSIRHDPGYGIATKIVRSQMVNADSLGALNSSDSKRQLRAQPTALRSLIRQPPNRGKMKIDRSNC